ncbi:type I phosphodiesterase/nucleotide pyrophosphatase [Candidatus Nitrososphaera gargensis Ga9.2]|uniref:Type I phosphodiesterase/nucleotide pyrophosphatase n=1 Tax=Nitrososphaera gargensis (strain Ga9.2) TaxID=1237085 RepID=K0IDA9_NITGG|nr:nucleotide pyrophosphatase/phosphodiesterase family protein [Candidatus Nitrososphaera gargensis]AFU57650.1 type I phosphodiesterase/nucleotide pyrophosphatase [Candidatus Nitrososphaera gargensis Ga9.2]
MVAPEYSIVLDIVGLEVEHLNSGLVPNIAKIANDGEYAKLEPVFPAVTCTVQASLLSGKYPNEHGIVANGLYDRNAYFVSFWEQPSSLVRAERIWDRRNSCTSAVLFWQNTMYANSDIVVTPRPIHLDDGVVMWCYSKPVGYYEELRDKLGEFDLASYWGPLASPRSSEWIANAAEYTLEKHRPNQLFAYIPHVDYSVQRFGKSDARARDDLKKADDIVGRLVQKTSELGIKDKTQFIIISEYSFNDVQGAIPLNLVLRDAGLLAVREIQDKEYLDFEFSKAFAMVDHQAAHIFVKDGFERAARKILEATAGIDKVLDSEGKKRLKIDHERSGELVAIAERDKWFSYYWWHDEKKAPAFARKVDIHRKPGYDPVELFVDPKTKSIPLDASLVRGSHGRPADLETGEGLAFYASSSKHDITKSGIAKCTDIIKCLAAA